MSAIDRMKRYGFLLILANVLATLTAVVLLPKRHAARPPSSMARRFGGMLRHLPKIENNAERKTLFIGESVWHYCLSPLSFDAAAAALGKETTSYNLAFAQMMGPPLYAFVRRLELEFKPRRPRFALTLIAFSPAAYSERFYKNHWKELDVSLPGVFFSPRMLPELILSNPPDALNMLFNSLVGPVDYWQDVRDFLGLPKPAAWDWPGVVALFGTAPFREKTEWNPKTRGMNNWNLPASKRRFERVIAEQHSQANWAEIMRRFSLGAGIGPKYALPPRMLKFFINSVKVAKGFSARTYVVVMPYAPSFQALADRHIDYETLLRKIRTKAGVDVIDLRSALPLKDEDFCDAMHPRHETMDRLLGVLARRVADDLPSSRIQD